MFMPIAGAVTGLEKTHWRRGAGRSRCIAARRRSAFLIPVYVAVLSATVFGLIGGFGLMKRDRVGGC